jgi:hypothetical protein
MPTGPKGEKRPADVIGNAVKVMRIATGEEVESSNLSHMFFVFSTSPLASSFGLRGEFRRAPDLQSGGVWLYVVAITRYFVRLGMLGVRRGSD